MADSATPPVQGAAQGTAQAQQALSIPEDLQKKYHELLELIKGSESMNTEERQYWINILPIMTPDQIQNLKDILDNERKQLAAIDAKYQSEIQKIGKTEVSRQTEEERQKRRSERQSQEASHKQNEDQEAEALLKQIEGQ